MTAIILTVFLLLDTLFLSYGALPSQEIGALFNFFNATNGPDWKWKDESRFGPMWNFDETKDPCNDNGVVCVSYIFVSIVLIYSRRRGKE